MGGNLQDQLAAAVEFADQELRYRKATGPAVFRAVVDRVPFVEVLRSLREGVHTENVYFVYRAFGIRGAYAFHLYEANGVGFVDNRN